VPRILALAAKYGVSLTFFVPAVSGQLHPETIDAILKSPLRHEIGIHGWVHERLSELTPEEERELTRRRGFW